MANDRAKGAGPEVRAKFVATCVTPMPRKNGFSLEDGYFDDGRAKSDRSFADN